MRTSFLAACAVAIGCSPTEQHGSPFIARDSAELRIAENAARSCSDADDWRLPEEPSISIGAVDGPSEYLLSLVRGAARLADGRIAVADGASSSIRFFAADGRFLSSSGRQGRGPGEYLDISGMSRIPGDSIVVMDGVGQRISFLDSEGVYRRSTGLQLIDGFYNVALYNVAGIREDGRILAYASAGMGLREEFAGRLILDSLHFFSFDRRGSDGRWLITMPGAPRWGLRVGGAVGFPYVPFGGGPISAAGRDQFVIGSGVDGQLLLFGSGSEAEQVIRWPGRRAAGNAERERLNDALLGPQVNDAQRTSNRRLLAEAPLPDSLPAARAVVVAEGGDIWVERYRGPGESSSIWEVFDDEGRWLGTVHAPARFRVHEIGAGYVLGTARDDLGVERVQQYGWTMPACDPR